MGSLSLHNFPCESVSPMQLISVSVWGRPAAGHGCWTQRFLVIACVPRDVPSGLCAAPTRSWKPSTKAKTTGPWPSQVSSRTLERLRCCWLSWVRPHRVSWLQRGSYQQRRRLCSDGTAHNARSVASISISNPRPLPLISHDFFFASNIF